MTQFFTDISSFSSWLASKTDTELKTRLTRADPGARLNGSKPDLVRRLVESTRNLSNEQLINIFPELRRRQNMPRAAAAQNRRQQEDRLDLDQDRLDIGGLRSRPVLRAVAGSSSSRSNISSARPVPSFHGNPSYRRSTNPDPLLAGVQQQLHTRTQHYQERAMTPVRPSLRNLFPGKLIYL